MKFDGVNDCKYVMGLVPIVKTGDTNCAVIDHQGAHAIEHLVFIGANGDTFSGSVKIDLKLQDGTASDGSDMAAVTDANDVVIPANSHGGQGVIAAPSATGVVATIDANGETSLLYRIGYKGSKRYSRMVLDFTGTHTNGTICGEYAKLDMVEIRPA